MLTWVDLAEKRVRLTRYDRFACWVARNYWAYCLALGLMLLAGTLAVWRIG